MTTLNKKLSILCFLVFFSSLVSYAQERGMHNYSDLELDTISYYIKSLEEADLDKPFMIDVNQRETVLDLLSLNGNVIEDKDMKYHDFKDDDLSKLIQYIDILEQRNSSMTTTEYQLAIKMENGEVKKYNFETLKAMKKFVKGLKKTDPLLAAQLKHGDELDITIITTDESKRAFKFTTLESMQEQILKMNSSEMLFSQKTKENSLHLELIQANGSTKKYDFQTLAAMNDFLLNLNTLNPTLSQELKSGNEFDVVLKSSNGELRKYKFKTLEAMTEVTVNLKTEDKLLTQSLMVAEDVMMEIVMPDGKREKFVFKSLPAMNDYLMKLEETNPQLAAQLKSGDGFDVDMKMPNGEKKAYKFKTLNSMKDVTLKMKQEDYLLSSSQIASEDVMMEIIMPDGKREKFVFKSLPAMNDYLMKLGDTNPELLAQLKSGDGFDVDMKMPNGEKKAYNFKTLNSMTDVTLKMKQEDYALKADEIVESDYLMEIIMPDGKREKFVFKSLPAMNEYMSNLEITNPILAAQIKGAKDFDMKITIINELTEQSSLLYEEDISLNSTSTVVSTDSSGNKENSKDVIVVIPSNNVLNPESFNGIIMDEVDIAREFNYGDLSGKNICMNILFKPNYYAVTTDFMPVLDKVYESLMTNEKMHLIVEGHADLTGNALFNDDLSEKRAKSVVNYLKLKGIPSSRFKVVGHGHNKSVASNKTDSGRTQNRRVELLVK